MSTDQARRDAVNDAVGNALGRYRDIGIGPERTAFRRHLADALMPLLADWAAEAWDAGYEAGSDDEVFWARGLSTDSDADEHPHDNPYRAKGDA